MVKVDSYLLNNQNIFQEQVSEHKPMKTHPSNESNYWSTNIRKQACLLKNKDKWWNYYGLY